MSDRSPLEHRPPEPARPVWRQRSRLVRALRLWRTRDPQTFRQKVRYKMLRDRRPLVVTFADKAAVREYVAATVGPHYLPRAYAVSDDPSVLPELPETFVVKPTHGSGAAIIVSPTAPPDARLPPVARSWSYTHIRPEFADRAHIVEIGRRQSLDRRPTGQEPVEITDDDLDGRLLKHDLAEPDAVGIRLGARCGTPGQIAPLGIIPLE